MWDMDSNSFNFLGNLLMTLLWFGLLLLAGCSGGSEPKTETPQQFPLAQDWELQPGDRVADKQVLGGLGDISIALKGKSLYAPYNGRLQSQNSDCAIFTSEEVSAYVLRICGLSSPKFGSHSQGEAIGQGQQIQLALLSKQTDGKWAMVEPSREMIEQMLEQP